MFSERLNSVENIVYHDVTNYLEFVLEKRFKTSDRNERYIMKIH